MSRKLTWWRGNISEHPLVSQRHSQIVTCGKGCFRWLNFHLPLRLEAMILVAMLAANIAPIVGFYSLYVGNNTYFTGTDAVSRRSQILRHLANRCAMLGISQLPMLILLSSKRTPVAILSQLSMNTMMLFHRWIARTCYCHIIIHTLGNTLIFHYSVGFVESMRLLPVQLGTVALIMLSGLVFLSLRTLRKKHYEMFVFMHISMAFFMILFTYLHIRFLHQGRVSHKRNQNRLQQKLTPSQLTTRNTATTPDLRHRADYGFLGFRQNGSISWSSSHVALLEARRRSRCDPQGGTHLLREGRLHSHADTNSSLAPSSSSSNSFFVA